MPNWPGTLPDLVSQSDYQEGFANTILKTSMDTGKSKRRRRFTAAVKPLRATVPLTGVELDIFTAWFETDSDGVKGGSLSFDYTHPRTGATVSVSFTDVPKPATFLGLDRYSVTLDLEINP